MKKHKTALITGASGGLGLEFAKILARKKYDLVLVARNEGRLYALKNELETEYGISVYPFAADLSVVDAAYKLRKLVGGVLHTERVLRRAAMYPVSEPTVICIILQITVGVFYLKDLCSSFIRSSAAGVKVWYFLQMINISAFGTSLRGRKMISLPSPV